MSFEDCLAYDPFADDFGSPQDRILRDVIVTCRVGHWCHMCDGDTTPGTRTRLLVAIFDGDLRYFRWCADCCEAMAKDMRTCAGLDHVIERIRLRDTRSTRS